MDNYQTFYRALGLNNSMALGDVNTQNDKIQMFRDTAVGLGYDPAQVESFSKLAATAQTYKQSQEERAVSDWERKYRMQKEIDSEFARKQDEATIDDLIGTRQKLVDAGLDTSAIDQKLAIRGVDVTKQVPKKPETLKDLVALRKTMIDAGLDTSAIDSQINKHGVDTKKKPESKSSNEAIQLVDEILKRDTKPLTGYLKMGGVPLINQKEATATKAKIEQLKGKLQLAAAAEMKGQGQMSDKERELLAKAATALDYNMSDDDFKEELKKIKRLLGGGTSQSNDMSSLMDKYWGKK